MSRPAGVTVSAVVEFLGSAFVLLMGGLIAFGAMMSRQQMPSGPEPMVVAIGATVIGVVCVSLAVLGIWTGVALLKLRPWARISTLVFAGCMSVFSALVVVMMLIMPTPPGADGQQNSPFDAMRPFFAGMYAIPFAIGVLWLVYFNRAEAKAAFAAPYEPGAPPARPLSISIIGWLSAVGGMFVIPMALARFPAFIAGFVITGWSATFVYLVFGVIALYLGWAVLKLKEIGRRGMIGWYALTMLHGAYVSLVPSARAHFDEVQRSMPFASSAPPVVASGTVVVASMLFGVVVGAVVIWFLVKERSSFSKSS